MAEQDNQLIEHFHKIQKANKEGYAGCMPNGNLVDRREHPEAYPVSENSMFNVSKPRCIKCNKESDVDYLFNSLCADCRKDIPVKLDEIINEEFYVLVAPDGAAQVSTLAPDFPMCIAMCELMAQAGIGEHPALLFEKGFSILPVTITMKQNGDENKPFKKQ